MKTILATIFTVFAFQVAAGPLPDHNLTPGEANPVLTTDVICAKGFTTKTYRHVTSAMKRQVYALYNMQPFKGTCAPKGCEVDHLISLSIGGANSIKNLWPQPFGGPWNARMKDRLENRLHTLVCDGKMDLKEAQHEISTDWVSAYKKQFGTHGSKPWSKTS